MQNMRHRRLLMHLLDNKNVLSVRVDGRLSSGMLITCETLGYNFQVVSKFCVQP